MKYHEQDNEKDGFQCLLEILSRRKGLIIIGALSIFIISCVGAYFLPPLYETFTTVLIQQEKFDLKGEYVSPLSTDTFLGSQRVIITSRQVLGEVVKNLRLAKEEQNLSFHKRIINKFFKIVPDPFEEAIRDLQKKISVESTGIANVISIKATLKDPFEAALIANSVASVYIDYFTKMRLDKAQDNYNFIAEQVEAARKKLTESEDALKNFKENEKLASIKEKTTNLLDSAAEIKNQYLNTKLAIKDLENQLSQVKQFVANKNWEEILSRKLINNPKAEELRGEIEKIESILSQLSNQYSEAYIKSDPKATLLVNQLTVAKDKLIKEIENSFHQLEMELDSLKHKEEYFKNIITQSAKMEMDNKISDKELELNRLTRDLKINEELYLLLLKKMEGTRISEVTEKWSMGGVKVIDRATPPPYPLRKKKIMLPFLGVCLGIIFGMAMAFFAEYKDHSLKTPQEVEQYCNLDVLGVVPLTSKKYRKFFIGF